MKRSNILLCIILFLGTLLRFYQIDNNPPGLYVDEVSIGYNAYTILQGGVDEHGVSFPLFFKAFGEYKMPAYIYTTAAAMAVFGKNEFAVRFVSALSGVLTLFVFYHLVNKLMLFDKSKEVEFIREKISLLAFFLLAISSWHIHFSRGGFEVSLGVLLYISGLFFYITYWEKRNNFHFLIANIFLLLSVYTYNTFRIVTPITWAFLGFIFLRKLPKKRKSILFSMGIFILLFIPMALFSLTPGGAERFSQASAFSEYIAETTPEKIITYPMVFIKNYLSFFSLDFLFGSGDGIGRHQPPGFGLLYRWQLPFLLIGFGWLISRNKKLLKYAVLAILFITPLPAALTRPSPHSLRVFLMVIPLLFLISLGILVALKALPKVRKYVVAVVSIIAMYEFLLFMHFYHFHYPKINSLDWGAGNKSISEKASIHRNEFDYIVVENNLAFAATYLKFYDDSLHPYFVDSSWKIPEEWKGKKILWIRPDYGTHGEQKIIDRAYLQGNSNDVYAEFWKLQ
jgi:4-amino-4-deoxy-L-arabinose transferase-like glycosyltransferase